MNYTKYVLVVLGIVALVAVIAGGTYATFYFRAQRTALDLENEAVAKQAALTAPSIRTDRFSCGEFAPDSKTQSYSIDIRTNDAAIADKQQQVINSLQALGATITSNSRGRQKDFQAGYSTTAQVQATLPMSQAATFISQLKTGIASPEYTENEYSSTLDVVWFKQSCDSSIGYLKNLASSEALYLNQLASQTLSPAEAADINQRLTETRQSAVSYEASLDSLMGQLYKTQISVNVLQIPG